MRNRALLSLVISGLLLNTAASRTIQPPSKQATSGSSVALPFELANKHIVLKVRVNNSRPLSFVLDTGDKFAIIDLERARELKLDLHGQVRMGGAGSQLSTVAFVRDASFTIPGFDGFSQPMALALPISNFAGRLRQDFDGIIGSDFIKEFVVEVDYQARLIKLHDKRTFTYSGSGETIPIKLNSHGHPIIEAEVTPMGSAPIKGKIRI